MPDETAATEAPTEDQSAPESFVESAWGDREGVMRTNQQKKELVAAALERRAKRVEGRQP